MNAFFYAIGDLFEAFFPVFKAVGGPYNVFWILLGFTGIVGWVFWLQKHKDAPEKLD